jgi:hypothetical protein
MMVCEDGLGIKICDCQYASRRANQEYGVSAGTCAGEEVEAPIVASVRG